jgi:hypothetical protein
MQAFASANLGIFNVGRGVSEFWSWLGVSGDVLVGGKARR